MNSQKDFYRDLNKGKSLMSDVFGELHFPYKVLKKVKLTDLPQIRSSRAIFDYIWPVYEPNIYEREIAYAVFISRSNRVLGRYKVSEGSLDGCVLGIDMIMARAILIQARGIFFIHNHPSGNLRPSDADIKLVKDLKAASDTLKLTFLDSLIISPDGKYFSFADEGIM